MSITFHTPLNNVSTTVGSMYTAGSGSLVVATGTGAQFGSTFPLIITASQSGTILSILEVTGRSTDTLTISGAIPGYTDVNLSVGNTIDMRPTALAITELQNAITGGPSTNGQEVLSSTYAITADNDWEDTGLTVTLPAAGTYLLLYNARCAFSLSGAGDEAWMSVRLYDSTSSAVVADSSRLLFDSSAGDGFLHQVSAGYSVIYAPTVSTTISLQAYRERGGGTWNVSSIYSNSDGYTALLYIRLL